ncbi:GNAT family N-acetyltransferase [Leucobacter albus]|uniref:GNAT family N-acetyltransferase n=1 Tax=Leucobacter albus TaxID=272210 RepID=A0ABW3TLZ6_9MICO
MSTHLSPVTHEEFPTWQASSIAAYAADLIEAGVSPEAAKEQAEQSISAAFPSGESTSTNAVFGVLSQADEHVGYVWVGRDSSTDPTSWWVWDITIDPAFRGSGYGRSSMQLAEDYARSQGAVTPGLSVFGFNATARGLYESLGYETTSVKMRKTLTEA